MNVVISVFVMPYEMDDLHRIFSTINLQNISDNCILTIDVSLALSDELINWGKSSLPKSFFIQKFLSLQKNYPLLQYRFNPSETTKGCVDQRRQTLNKYPDADYFIWLDSDIIFSDATLKHFEQAIALVHQKQPLSIITPEIVRIWDTTWDCLVNEKFLSKPLNYQKTNDPYVDCGVKGQLTLEEVHNRAEGQPRFKFAGGWFTCISGELLRLIGIPDSFAPYGLEDTFIMWAAEYLVRSGKADIKQYKIKNLVVCENYKYRDYSHYTNHMTIIDRREEYLAQTRKVFNLELQRFLQ